MARPDELEVKEKRERMFAAARRAEAALGRASKKALIAALALGVLVGRVPAARRAVLGGVRWLIRARALKL